MICPNSSSVFDVGIAVVSTCHTSNSYSWVYTCLYNFKYEFLVTAEDDIVIKESRSKSTRLCTILYNIIRSYRNRLNSRDSKRCHLRRTDNAYLSHSIKINKDCQRGGSNRIKNQGG